MYARLRLEGMVLDTITRSTQKKILNTEYAEWLVYVKMVHLRAYTIRYNILYLGALSKKKRKEKKRYIDCTLHSGGIKKKGRFLYIVGVFLS